MFMCTIVQCSTDGVHLSLSSGFHLHFEICFDSLVNYILCFTLFNRESVKVVTIRKANTTVSNGNHQKTQPSTNGTVKKRNCSQIQPFLSKKIMGYKGENILLDSLRDDALGDVSESSDYGGAPEDDSHIPANPPDGMNDHLDHVISQMPTNPQKIIEGGNCPDQEPDDDRDSSDGSSGSLDSSRDSSPSHEPITAKWLEVRLITLVCN